MTAITPDLNIAASFIEALTGSRETPMRVRFIDDDKKRRRTPEQLPTFEREGSIAELWSEIEQRQAERYGVFYVLNETRPRPGSGYEGCASDADIAKVRAVAADFDDGLPTEEWEYHAAPHLIVRTSAGRGQAIWLTRDLPIEDFKPVCRRLINHYKSDPAIQNPSRVLRLPGSLHQKGEPQLVTFERREGGNVCNGLPELPPVHVSDRIGEPVDLDHFKEVLRHVDPNVDYPAWRDIVAAIHATNAGSEGERYEIAKAWSRVEQLDPEGRFDSVWETMPPRAEGGVGYGTIYNAARKAGYDGPANPRKSGVEMFAAFGEAVDPATVEAPPTVPDCGDPEVPTMRPLFEIMGIGEVLRLPDPVPLIEDVLMEGENFVLYGPPKKGKSLFTLDVALSVAANVPVLGKLRVHRTGPVVYFSSEGLTYLKQRIRAWMHARGIGEDRLTNFHYVTNVPMAGDPDDAFTYFKAVREHLGEEQPVLIVIDTLSRSLGSLDENASASMNLYEAMTRMLMREFRCCCYTIAHIGKDTSRGLRGSNAALANFDAVAELEEKADGRIFSRIGRGVDGKPFGIKREQTVIGETLQWCPPDAVKADGGRGGITSQGVGAALKRLTDDGCDRITTPMLAAEIWDADPKGFSSEETIRRRLQREGEEGKRFSAYVKHPGTGKADPTIWHLPPIDGGDDV